MANNPKVFISYSHDSPEHKQWVSELAAILRQNGIDAILDQWDLGLGDDGTRFMERGIVDADRVLVICTDEYVSKANANEGGVGYERMIVNAELVQNLGTDKFIPIIRQASGKEKTPTFLGTRVYADFRNESQFDAECEKLIRELHEMPIAEKPPLGKSPFPSAELDTQPTEIQEHIESASEAYKIATKLARAGDVLGWRELVKYIRPKTFKNLVQWRENELDGQKPKGKKHLAEVVDKAIEIISPLMAVALVGVESGREEFRNQKALLDDLFNVVGWNAAGHTIWVNLPYALGYVYHSLHGCVCLSTNQINLALDIAQVKIPIAEYPREYSQVWKISKLVKWVEYVGPGHIERWEYLANAHERWKWLSVIFENDPKEYRVLLAAYYMALNIHELAVIIASDQQGKLNRNYDTSFPFDFNIPLTFMSENQDIYQRAVSLLRRNSDTVTELWTILNVTHEQMKNLWGNWMLLYKSWLKKTYISSTDRNSAISSLNYEQNLSHHQDFFEML